MSEVWLDTIRKKQMTNINKLLSDGKIVKITTLPKMNQEQSYNVLFMHRGTQQIHLIRTSNLTGYVKSFFTKCKEETSSAKSEFFSVFAKSTNKNDWDIFTVNGFPRQAEDLYAQLQLSGMKALKKILRCKGSEVPEGMYVLYKISTRASPIVRWFISMQPHTDVQAIEKAKFFLSGMSVNANADLSFRDNRNKFMTSKEYTVVRYPDADILKTVSRPSMYSRLSAKLNSGELTYPTK